jgi:hypothetical protein
MAPPSRALRCALQRELQAARGHTIDDDSRELTSQRPIAALIANNSHYR